MLLGYLFGRQLLCRRCLSFVKSQTRQQRLHFLLPRKQLSTALPRLSFPPESNHQTPSPTTESTSPPDAAPDLPRIPKGVKLHNDDIIPLNGEIHYVDANHTHRGIVKFADVINSFDRGEYTLICVNPNVVSQNEPPTCLLTSIAQLREKERRQAQAAAEALLKSQAKTVITTKELELTWAISSNDLMHKMKKMGGFMRKGNRVEVTIGTRKGMAKVSADQAQEVVAKVKETGAEFGSEWKKKDGVLGKQITLFFEGKAPVKPEGEDKFKGRKKKKRKFLTPEELEAEREKNRGEGGGV